MRNLFGSVALVGLALSSASALAEGPDEKTTSQRFKDWESICVERASTTQCRATQTLVNQQGQTVAVLNWYRPNAERMVFELAVPLLVDLSQGVAVSFDGAEPLKRNLRFCNNVACFVLAESDQELLDNFKRGSGGTLSFTPFGQQSNALNFSLQGFSAAYDSLK